MTQVLLHRSSYVHRTKETPLCIPRPLCRTQLGQRRLRYECAELNLNDIVCHVQESECHTWIPDMNRTVDCLAYLQTKMYTYSKGDLLTYRASGHLRASLAEYEVSNSVRDAGWTPSGQPSSHFFGTPSQGFAAPLGATYSEREVRLASRQLILVVQSIETDLLACSSCTQAG